MNYSDPFLSTVNSLLTKFLVAGNVIIRTIKGNKTMHFLFIHIEIVGADAESTRSLLFATPTGTTGGSVICK